MALKHAATHRSFHDMKRGAPIGQAQAGTNVLAVPEEAAIHSGQRNIVVLDRGNGTFQVKEITLGDNLKSGNGTKCWKKSLTGRSRIHN